MPEKSEKGFLHKARRMTLGRNAEEHETHEKNLDALKEELNKNTQETIDELGMRYENHDVREKIAKAHGEKALDSFLSELKGLQVSLIEAKTHFLKTHENDQVNDIEDVQDEMKQWQKEKDEILNGSYFRELAEKYEVWGHEQVEFIQSGVHEKIHHIRPAA